MDAFEHHSHVAFPSVIGMYAHLCNPANTIRKVFGFNLLLVYTNVRNNRIVLVTHNPPMGIRLPKIPSISEDHILRLGETSCQQTAEFMVQGVSYIVIRKIFYLWIHSLWHNCSYQRQEFLAYDCMTLLVYLCFILINYLILKQYFVLVISMNFDKYQRSANLRLLILIGLFKGSQHIPLISLIYKNKGFYLDGV